MEANRELPLNAERRRAAQHRWLVDVVVMPKPGVNDPQGEAILGGLHSLGYGEVDQVRSGRFVRLVVAADSADAVRERVEQMCSQFLANPVIEAYRIDAVRTADGSAVSELAAIP